MKTTNKDTQFDLIQKGYKVLCQKMGATDSLRFIMSFYSGSGDSVSEFKKLWKDKSISEIARKLKTN